MKICIISFGPVESRSNGYFIRCYHMAKCLVKLGHEVYVLQFPEGDTINLAMFREGIEFINLRGNEIGRNRLSRGLKNKLTFDLFHSIKFQFCSLIELIRFRGYLKNSDIVFVEGSLILFGVILPKIFRKKVILDTHCINKILAFHFRDKNFLIYCVRKILWDILERFATKLSDVVIVVSEQERSFVRTEYKIPESKIFLVPNVIEMERKIYSKEELASVMKKWNLENKIIVTFIGDLRAVQNKDAVEYIINDLAPYFKEKQKNVIFLIIGRGNENFKYNLPNVIFTGFVEDIAPYLIISDVFISPLRVGAGIKTKILEYLAYRKYVVATPVSISGLEKFVAKQFVNISSIDDFKSQLFKTISNMREKTRPKFSRRELSMLKYLHTLFQDNLSKAITAAYNKK